MRVHRELFLTHVKTECAEQSKLYYKQLQLSPGYQVTTRKALTVPEIRRDSRGTTHEALGQNTSSVPFSLTF